MENDARGELGRKKFPRLRKGTHTKGNFSKSKAIGLGNAPVLQRVSG